MTSTAGSAGPVCAQSSGEINADPKRCRQLAGGEEETVNLYGTSHLLADSLAAFEFLELDVDNCSLVCLSLKGNRTCSRISGYGTGRHGYRTRYTAKNKS